jgi:hypothetical protein
MSASGATVCGVDTAVILYCAEVEAPALRATAQAILESEAARLGAPLDLAEVLVRRAAGGPEMHITAAADKLVRHLVVTEADPLIEDSPVMVLARAGALALMSRIELGEGHRGTGNTQAL